MSNRLPFTVHEVSGDLRFTPSIGGLATGLSSYLESLREHQSRSLNYIWVGWPGSTIREENRAAVRSRSLAEFNALPVFLSERDIEQFYQGFCNKTIWPLFHYFPVYACYDEGQWRHYVEVNRAFCRTLLEILRPDDTLWIHDYHLMLLPAMLREQMPSAVIGFFLHIPFPNFEIFRLMPRGWRKEILRGLLGADLIGFHTNDYRQDFLRCVLRLLGHDSQMGEIPVADRVVKAETFPMGIDFNKYHDWAVHGSVQQERIEINGQLKEAKVILSIDRLDYSKGIANRLEAFQMFLEANPDWHCRVVLLLIVVPSRIDVEHYGQMKSRIEGLVGEINGRFGRPGWTPVVYMFKAFTFSPLVAIYAASHIALITPLRDGMNLIAKEYLAARSDATGVLILSEMAGASKELLEAIIINPNDRNEIVRAIEEALTMPEAEQMRRNSIMQQRLHRYDVVQWAADFMETLADTKKTRNKYSGKWMSSEDRRHLLDSYHGSRRRLILLDYDGTLVPFAIDPLAAVPDESLLRILGDLTADPDNDVVIISGRMKEFLDSSFSDLRIGLIAEHGAWIKAHGSEWRLMAPAIDQWKPKLRPLLDRYVNRIAGSLLEEKEFALVWHYRGADPEPGNMAAQELKDQLLALTANIGVHVLQGNRSVEIRISGVTKASAGLLFISQRAHDFILFVGDDETDEDLFAVLPEPAHSIRVGVGGTRALHTVPDVKDVVQLLKEMSLPKSQSARTEKDAIGCKAT